MSFQNFGLSGRKIEKIKTAFQSALIAWTVLTESIGQDAAAQDNRDLHKMMKLLQGITMLEVSLVFWKYLQNSKDFEKKILVWSVA